MEFEAWWLLGIPLFFVLGWLAARRDDRQEAAADSVDESGASYRRGLNHFLNDEFDAAVDAFVDVVRLDPESLDLHFALGALFRRRGESDRAIRVHRSLSERQDLPQAQRDRARYELGLDYLKAGLIDRAEQTFDELTSSALAAESARQRLEIAQMTHDWPRTIELAGTANPLIVAHAHCELAEEALRAGRLDEAGRDARLAWAAMPDHPRPHLLQGRIALARSSWSEANGLFVRLAEGWPAHVALAGFEWWEGARRLGADEAALQDLSRRLRGLAEGARSIDLARIAAQSIAVLEGPAAARMWLLSWIGTDSTLAGLQAVLELDPPQDPQPEQEALRRLLKRQAERMSRYTCGRCGFRARIYYWHCPGCNHWDTYPPVRAE